MRYDELRGYGAVMHADKLKLHPPAAVVRKLEILTSNFHYISTPHCPNDELITDSDLQK